MDLSKPPESGIDFYLPWGLLEWMVGALVGVAVWSLTWVWRLSVRLSKLEYLVVENKKAIEDQAKVNAERYDKIMERLVEMHKELPSKFFIEAQLDALGRRLDAIADRLRQEESP